MNASKSIHEGYNVKRIREVLGIKQDALALQLGLSQQAVSQLEQKEALDAEILELLLKLSKTFQKKPPLILCLALLMIMPLSTIFPLLIL